MSEQERVDPAASAELVSFVPRLTLDWLRDKAEMTWHEVDGTLAFVDISGFTAMSERLSSLGRAGAEEVTEVMNATFAALLAVAYAQGGGLLKFGGDALLLLYEGDRHAARAARAAFEMRRTLRAIGRPKTSAGAIQLKMHAGLHSGRFQFFLVGSSHRELLIAGPAASRTVEMEAASQAGEILLSAETAALLGDDELTEEHERGRLLRAAPSVRGAVEPLPNVEGIPLEVAVPAPLRAQLLEVGPLEGEHRSAAIAFLRFSGTDEIIATEGPEAAAEALERLVLIVQEAAAAHAVTFLESDIDRDGGRIILVSGAPQTFGDDEQRMLRTVRAIVDAGVPLPVHVGVSEGRVFTGQVGASFRRTYTVLGDTAALAARLMARAGEDEIWVSAGALARGGGSFESEELEPLTLKGKSEPVQAYVLGALRAAPERVEPADRPEQLPFFDRERERAVLGASVAPVRMGYGTLVELVGEPGIGKSRLAQELRDTCADMQQIELRCEQYESSTPYYPFRSFLRSLLAVHVNGGGEHNRAALSERLQEIDGELVPWAPLLAAPLDVEVASTPEVDDLDPSFWRARLHGVMGTLLGHLLDSPTLLVIDDVHWMDDASSELLRYLGTQLPSRPWLACTTRRPGDDGFAAATGTPPLPALTLRLEPLPEEDARALAVAAAGDRRLSDDEVAALMERAAGNPLFLRELASVGETAQDAQDLPETVESLVATRIDQLAPGDRALLRWASVLGVSFSGSLIADVLEDDPLVAAGSEAWARLGEFVERDPDVPGAFRFRHALIRDAAYEGLSFKRRRELHERVAEVIERRQESPEEVAEPLSLHYFNAGRWDDAWRHSLVAAARARDIYANADAARFYERALEAGRQLKTLEPAAIEAAWRGLGEARDAAGDYNGALAAMKESLRLLRDDPVAQARVHVARALARYRLGAYSDALRDVTAGLNCVKGLEAAEAKDVAHSLLARRAQIYLQQGRPRDAIATAHQVVEEAEPRGPSIALAHAYSALEGAYLEIGQPDKAVYEAKAAEIFRSLGAARSAAVAEMNLGVKAYAQGRWREATELYENALKEFERVGDTTQAAHAAANLGEVLISRQLLDEAETVLNAADTTLRASGYRLAAMFTETQLARVAIEKGELPHAVETLTALVQEARESGEVGYAFEAWIQLASALTRSGQAERALLELEQAAELAGDAASPQRVPLAREVATALMQLGKLPLAEAELATALRIAREQGFAYEEAQALRALAALAELQGRESDAADARQEAERLMQRVGENG
jgi:class 3 adenylate cyclase/tetratricopeptide (TPR) repeat protein